MRAQELPYEIIYMIVDQLKLALNPNQIPFNKPHLAPYAGICKSWNLAIERETFRELWLNEEKLRYIEKVLNKDPSRGSAVHLITYKAVCDRSQHTQMDLCKGQLEERDRTFSSGLESLFRFLASVECTGGAREGLAGLHLELMIELYTVPPEDADGEYVQLSSADGRCLAIEYSDPEYDQAPVRYVGNGLPEIHCVRQFEILQSDDPVLWGSTITTIMSAMDGLEYCHARLNDEKTVDPDVHIDYREGAYPSLIFIRTPFPFDAPQRLTLAYHRWEGAFARFHARVRDSRPTLKTTQWNMKSYSQDSPLLIWTHFASGSETFPRS